jgi:hypothetical protein
MQGKTEMLQRSNFVIYTSTGAVHSIFCKVCGKQIAHSDGRLRRSRFYTEARFRLSNNAFHVTNGCSNCLTLSMSSDMMRAIYEADMADLGMGSLSGVHPVKVVAVATGGQSVG